MDCSRGINSPTTLKAYNITAGVDTDYNITLNVRDVLVEDDIAILTNGAVLFTSIEILFFICVNNKTVKLSNSAPLQTPPSFNKCEQCCQ